MIGFSDRPSIDDVTPDGWDKSRDLSWCTTGGKDRIKLIHSNKEQSDGSSAKYYELPKNASEIQDLISAKNMNAQIGEIFRECYRYGKASHCDEERGIRKILFYANAELKRLTNLKGN